MTEEFYIPKIIKGIGSFNNLGEEVKKIGAHPLVLTGGSNRYKHKIIDLLEDAGIDLYDDDFYSIGNEPTLNDAEKCLRVARDYRHDSVIGIGGGSVLDVAKCVAAIANNEGCIRDYTNLVEKPKTMKNPSLPKILIPTTAGSGSEATRVSVLIDDRTNKKGVIYNNRLYADIAILDGALTVSLPKEATAYTGMDAFVHAFEAYTSRKANHMTDALACEAMKLISNNIIDVYMDGNNLRLRQAMLEASCMAGSAFINSSSGPIHGAALPINSKYKIPHGKAVAMMLPHVTSYNIGGEREEYQNYRDSFRRFEEVRRILDEKILTEGIASLLKNLNIPSDIPDINPGDIDSMSEETLRLNPRLFENGVRKIDNPEAIKGIYYKAMTGLD